MKKQSLNGIWLYRVGKGEFTEKVVPYSFRFLIVSTHTVEKCVCKRFTKAVMIAVLRKHAYYIHNIKRRTVKKVCTAICCCIFLKVQIFIPAMMVKIQSYAFKSEW